MIPLYITHNGHGVTAHYSLKDKTIVKSRAIHLVDFKKRWIHGYQSVVIAMRSEQNFSATESDTHFTVEDSLVDWCKESTKVAFSGVVRDSSAVSSLMGKHISDHPEVALFIYQCEERIIFQLDHCGKTVSLVHIAAIELSQGVEKLLERVMAWYDQNGITHLPQATYLIGQVSDDSLLSTSMASSIERIFPETEMAYIIAAGVVHVPADQRVVNQPSLNLGVRITRHVLLALSIAVLLGSLIGYGTVRAKTESVLSSIETSELTLDRSDAVISYRDSLYDVARHHLVMQEQLKNHHRWSDILDEFSVVPHDGVRLKRFGSRGENGILEIAFDGEGDTERSVTGFVEAIKLSPTFGNVQLTQLTRGTNGKQEFRIQCIIQ